MHCLIVFLHIFEKKVTFLQRYLIKLEKSNKAKLALDSSQNLKAML